MKSFKFYSNLLNNQSICKFCFIFFVKSAGSLKDWKSDSLSKFRIFCAYKPTQISKSQFLSYISPQIHFNWLNCSQMFFNSKVLISCKNNKWENCSKTWNLNLIIGKKIIRNFLSWKNNFRLLYFIIYIF